MEFKETFYPPDVLHFEIPPMLDEFRAGLRQIRDENFAKRTANKQKYCLDFMARITSQIEACEGGPGSDALQPLLSTRACIHYELSTLQFSAGDNEAAQDELLLSMSDAQRAADTQSIFLVFMELGIRSHFGGAYAEATQYFQLALRHANRSWPVNLTMCLQWLCLSLAKQEQKIPVTRFMYEWYCDVSDAKIAPMIERNKFLIQIGERETVKAFTKEKKTSCHSIASVVAAYFALGRKKKAYEVLAEGLQLAEDAGEDRWRYYFQLFLSHRADEH